MSLDAPFRIAFDNARDPYAARNALGIPQSVISGGGGGGGGAPTNAEYITASADATLTNERVLTNTATVTWDFSTPGQAKASTSAGGGNVSNSGTPVLGQYARWVTATTISGVTPAMVLSDIGAAPLASPTFTGDPKAPTPATADNDTSIATTAYVQAQGYLTSSGAAAAYQPLDADLTSLAAASAIGAIYYRSAANTWATVTISTGLSFVAGTLTNTVSIAGLAPLANPVFTGDPQAPTPATADNDTSIATTAFVKAQGYATTASVTAGFQPLDATLTSLAAFNTNGLLTQTAADTFTGRSIAVPAAGISITNANGVAGNPTLALANDLASLEAAAGTNTIYYRSATDTWSPVVVSTGLAFSGGNLTATAGGGNVSTSGTITTGLYAKWVTTTTIQSVANATVLSDIGAAPLNAPTFTGDAKAVTPAAGDNDTSIATTAFVTSAIALAPTINCGRLAFVSATALSFKPYNGDRIKINGTIFAIPSAGIAGVANTSVFVNGTGGQNLAASTVYWVFAFSNAGVVTADFRTAATHAPSATAGNVGTEILTGNDTRTLIGMAVTDSGAGFNDFPDYIGVISWFNRRNKSAGGANTSGSVTGSTVTIELNSVYRAYFLTWAEEAVHASVSGTASCASAPTPCGLSVLISGTVYGVSPIATIATSSGYSCLADCVDVFLGDGFYYITPGALNTDGIASAFYYHATVLIRG